MSASRRKKGKLSRKSKKKRRLVRNWSNKKFKKEINDSLEEFTPNFQLDFAKNNRRTNHAQLIDLVLREDDLEFPAVAKRYLHMGRPSGKYHKLFNTPNSLQSRESRNLKLIRGIVGSELVPNLYLSNELNNISVIERICG